jgi:hypothetical protein
MMGPQRGLGCAHTSLCSFVTSAAAMASCSFLKRGAPVPALSMLALDVREEVSHSVALIASLRMRSMPLHQEAGP